jgi:hypothetical protein
MEGVTGSIPVAPTILCGFAAWDGKPSFPRSKGPTMTKEDLTAWALANGWQMIDGFPSLTKPAKPHPAIVRLVLKATVASVEIKKPAGKWEKVSSESYTRIEPDPDTGMPGGLGLATISGLTSLMQDNKDRQLFARF